VSLTTIYVGTVLQNSFAAIEVGYRYRTGQVWWYV